MVDPVRFGVVPGHNVFSLTQRVRSLLDLLSKACGHQVILQTAFSYEKVLQSMLKDEYDLVLVGPELYARARAKGAPYRARVQPLRHGLKGYKAMFIARADSDINRLSDVAGRSITFVDRNSSSGYLFPKAMLNLNGLTDDKLGARHFSGTHDQVVKDVLAGAYDVGVCYEDARVDALKHQPDRVDELNIIARTLPIPNEPIVFSQRFITTAPALAGGLLDAFLAMHNSDAGKSVLERMGFDRFTRADEAAFEQIVGLVEEPV